MNFLKSYLNYEFDFLKKLEADGAGLKILKLEEELAANFTLQHGGIDVKLRGNIDRLDETDGVVRIIDYKTGDVKSTELTVNDWGDFHNGNKLDKAFQVLMYAWLVQRTSRVENAQYESGVISMRKLSDGFIKFGVKQPAGRTRDTKVTGEVFQQFEDYLTQLLEEIFDAGIPFEQTKDTEICERCNFNNLCSRV
jgi:CRISPR/Cas system-associated exonuclease Cas4 (RecB family)